MKRDEYAIRAANAVYQHVEQGYKLREAITFLLLAIVIIAVFYAAC